MTSDNSALSKPAAVQRAFRRGMPASPVNPAAWQGPNSRRLSCTATSVASRAFWADRRELGSACENDRPSFVMAHLAATHQFGSSQGWSGPVTHMAQSTRLDPS